MKSMHVPFLVMSLTVVSVPAVADILSLPTGGFGVTKSATSAPRGASQEDVLRRFGEPQQRYRPVGEPAISSWEYGDFRVYFEDGLVLHTVVAVK